MFLFYTFTDEEFQKCTLSENSGIEDVRYSEVSLYVY